MKAERFEDLLFWKKAEQLVLFIYKEFGKCKDYSFCDQIRRASVSVMNNIAEGFERKSNNDFKNFLFIAKGSCGEVRSMLYLALELKYINEREYKELNFLATEISKMISGFIKTL